MTYDPQNVFAKILRGEFSCNKIYEDPFVLAFHDKFPKAPVHVLIIPKGAYINYSDFLSNGSSEEILAFFKGVQETIKLLNLSSYRLISNCGHDGGQEVPHFHMHILAGEPLGPLRS